MRVLNCGTPLKSGYFSAVGLSSVKMVAVRHIYALVITSTDDKLYRNVNIDDFK